MYCSVPTVPTSNAASTANLRAVSVAADAGANTVTRLSPAPEKPYFVLFFIVSPLVVTERPLSHVTCGSPAMKKALIRFIPDGALISGAPTMELKTSGSDAFPPESMA